MKTIDFVRDHRAVIGDVLAQHRATNPRYIGEEMDDVEVVLLVQPAPDTSYFEIFELEDQLAAQLRTTVMVLTPGGLKGEDRDRIEAIAQEV
ncbi:hypothetical protein GRT41_22695 [Burkholderia pseudomallei]|uniref:hypothetical protein n=1 Tax=Burkholderia pseudomallei TaxID=28450 RepID=UPI0011BE7B79|nr:hypothetical protein [Burkholderia pseudomallei]MXK59266.1 hypothetical protein [Burkholderia pseudomallei]MXN58939.1 hypothetical protein [Burkholderia pseudomallei]